MVAAILGRDDHEVVRCRLERDVAGIIDDQVLGVQISIWGSRGIIDHHVERQQRTEVAKAFGHPSVTENPERGSRDDGLDVKPLAAATWHARAEDFIVKIDIDDLWNFALEDFDSSMCNG